MLGASKGVLRVAQGALGHRGSQVVGALISVFMIWMMTGGLLLEALQRLLELEEVTGEGFAQVPGIEAFKIARIDIGRGVAEQAGSRTWSPVDPAFSFL